MKDLIENAVERHGKKKVLNALITMGVVEETPQERGPCKEETCRPGYYFNMTVCACVLDVG